MKGRGPPKDSLAVIPGEHPGGIYRRLKRNRTGGVYTGQQGNYTIFYGFA
jgi:hypothetical protein